MLLPSNFIHSVKNAAGFNESALQEVHQSNAQVTSVRFNPAKINLDDFCKHFSVTSKDKIPWCSTGYYLPQRPVFTTDPLFHAGLYYVQEASSMFLEQAVKQTCNLDSKLNLLDLCAAPGGKSTLLLSLLNNQSLLVSNEVIKTRVPVLIENIVKHGYSNSVVTNNDAKDFNRLPNFFDVIVVDAPCSGSGLFRKDAEAINEWSLQNVLHCSQRQQRILADVMPSLKEEGVLIYSTCSYSAEENEQVVDWLVQEFNLVSIKLNIDKDWNIVESFSEKNNAAGYRFYPDKIKGEGFFIAILKKKEQSSNQPLKIKNRLELLNKKELEIIKPWLNTINEYVYFKLKDEIIAMPSSLNNELTLVQNSLYIRRSGINIGTIIREDFLPSHELAMSSLVNKNIFSVELNTNEALQYLRKNEIVINTSYMGWFLVKCNNYILGWVKKMPNRVNNYYPKEWRILNR